MVDWFDAAVAVAHADPAAGWIMAQGAVQNAWTMNSNVALIAGLAAAGSRPPSAPSSRSNPNPPKPQPIPTHTRSTDMHIIPTTPPTKTFPAYYLGRPVSVYHRRYRRMPTASREHA